MKYPFRRAVFLFCFLKYLNIQWKTKPVYMEKFLINDPNDLGLLPLLSFHTNWRIKNYTANEYTVHTSGINICAWTKDPWTYTSPVGYSPRWRHQSLITDPKQQQFNNVATKLVGKTDQALSSLPALRSLVNMEHTLFLGSTGLRCSGQL